MILSARSHVQIRDSAGTEASSVSHNNGQRSPGPKAKVRQKVLAPGMPENGMPPPPTGRAITVAPTRITAKLVLSIKVYVVTGADLSNLSVLLLRVIVQQTI